MSNKVEVKATEYIQAHGRKKRWQKIVTALASVVVFCTTYALIMPAVTMQSDTYCGYEEHEHTDECYEETLTLICTLSEEGHVHNDGCYGEPELICGKKETEGHTHSESCYGEEAMLTCTLEETEGHTHGDGCWDMVLVCENTEPDHEHGDECYEKVLICEQEEREAHQHGEGCYEKPLICGLEECEPHQHDENCYGEPELICGLEEQEPHEHNDKCWEKTIDKEKLDCEKEEHKHTLQCYSCPGVDLENPEIWKNSVSSAVLSGKWNEDVIAVAKTQLGYHESTANYEVQEDGTTMKGITRYGQWYGIPYGDWCAMFCSFCIEYAGVEDYPLDCGCRPWITTLDKFGLYHSADSTEPYEPKPGDLIFFDFDPIVEGVERLSDHVGFVLELEKDENGVPVKLTTIEGNYGDKVSRVEYLPDDEHILGFGEMTENPDYVDPDTVMSANVPAAPECDCGSPNAELLGHSDKCARKAFVMTLCGEKSAEELHELWKQLSEDAKEFGLTYLSWIDQTKLAVLSELLASDPIEASAADGDISATITGVFPADAVAELQNLDENSNDLVKNYIENKLGGIGGGISTGAVDVGLYQNGEKLDLNGETVRVAVSGFDFDGMYGDELLVKAYHLKDTNAADLETLGETEPEIELIPASVDENGNIVFETDGFSVIYFTVDFHYLEKTYNLPGGESMLLSELFAELGLDFDPALIESVEFSDEELLEIIPVYGDDGETVIDWELNSLLPFGSQETLNITFLNGQVLRLDVTDAAGDMYLQKVTSIDTSGEYLILYENGNTKYALANNNSNDSAKSAVTLTADGDLFTCSTVTDNMKWKFSGSNNSYTIQNVGSGHYLYLSNSNFCNTSSRAFTCSYANSKWTISRANNSTTTSLSFRDDNFARTTETPVAISIYKIVDAPAPPTYWIPVSEITDIDANYLIVNNTSGYAVGLNAYNTPANMTPAEGHNGYYTTTLGSNYWWKFSAAGNSSTQTNVANTSYGIRLNSTNYSDPVSTRKTTNTLTYSNGYWTINNGSSYLRYYQGEDRVSSSTDTNAPERRQTIIYKQVTAPDREHASLIGTGGNQGNTGENYINLFDDDTSTKYCVPEPDNGKVVVYFQTDDGRRFIADGYALTTANDNANSSHGRLPDGWVLYGSNDENNWTILDRVTDPGMEAKNYTEYTYEIDYPLGYTYYKIEFDVSNMIQFSELQLFGEYGGDVPQPPTPSSFDSSFEHNKYIDAFRDGADNPNTDLDNRARSGQLPAGDDAYDLYRLYLDMTGKQEPMDLLIVVDGSGSMDKTDMEGGMARDTAITQFLNGSTSSATRDGFLSYFLNLNPENQVCVVQFYGASGNRDSHNISDDAYSYTGDSKVLKAWTHSNAFVNCANQSNNGTNYEAGLKRATEQFQSNAVKNDGHRKIMIFMSDGVPTYFLIDNSDVGFNANNYTLRSTDTGKRWGTGSYTTSSNYLNCKEPSKRAFDEFMAANPGVLVYTVGVSEDISATSQSESQSPEVLQYMADNGHGEFFSVTSNMNELKLRLQSLFYPAGVTITDYLSKYVRFYGTDPDVLVTMTNKTNGRVTKLYENGAVTAAAHGILSDVTFTDIDSSETPTGDYTGIVKAIFDPDYKFEPDYTYTLSFNVETTQTAYNEYAANIAGGQNAYGGVTGDEGTDYPGNTTSSEKPGFYSNLYADVTYKVSNVQMWEKYDDPVVQVKETQIDVEKVWSDGADKHEADEIEAELYMVNGTTETLIATVKLNKGNDWKATFKNLPAGNNTYKVVEKDDPNNPILTDYEVTVEKTPATSTSNEKWTITNTRKTIEIKILKVDMTDTAIENNPAEFELYTDEDLAQEHLLGTYTTGDDGYTELIAVDLNKDYFLVETKSPEGFGKMNAPAKFKVVQNSDNEYEIENESPQNQYFKIVENQLVLMVENPGGYELPQTGGLGLIPIYTFGTMLTAGALMYSHRKRRREGRAE